MLTIIGSLTGSSFLNETFLAHLRERLRGEEGDITNNGSTVEGIIEHAAKDFESKKRIVNIQGTMERWTLFVSGLRMSTHPRKRFDKNKVIFDQYVSTDEILEQGTVLSIICRIDFENIFLPCLNNIAELVKEQLVAAKAKGTEVKVSWTLLFLSSVLRISRKLFLSEALQAPFLFGTT